MCQQCAGDKTLLERAGGVGQGGGHSRCSAPSAGALGSALGDAGEACARAVPPSQPHPNPSHLAQRRVGHATAKVRFDQSRITTPVQQVTQALCFMSNKQVGKDLRKNLTPAGQFPFLIEVLFFAREQIDRLV